MIKKINVADLRVGMYIKNLNCSWLHHPFLSNHFTLSSEHALDAIRNNSNIHEIDIDTDLGVDVVAVETVSDNNTQLKIIASEQKIIAPKTLPLAAELNRAKLIHQEANSIVQATLENCRLGKPVEIKKLQPVVASITESIFRNADAIISLLRIKQADNYTFQHSVAVSTLLISFCHALEMPREIIEQVGLGGLLHDIGKMQIPNNILNKPGKLSDSEFKIMQMHVFYGYKLVEKLSNISPISAGVVVEHHEHYDGTGYPNGLNVDKLSQYGQMAAITDVYDALTSNRVYHLGNEPTEVLKIILKGGNQHFNPLMVQQFIRMMGIYPVGSLVKLESGFLGVVIEQHHSDLLHPKVRAIFNSKTRSYISPKDFDLSRPNCADSIVCSEIPAQWHIDPGLYLR